MREPTLAITGASGGVCQRVDDHLGLKFLGFADRGTLDWVVVSIFWIGGPICIEAKEEATIFEAYGGAWRHVAWHLNIKFLGFVDRGLMYLVVAPVL